jgi:hypothetical protein
MILKYFVVTYHQSTVLMRSLQGDTSECARQALQLVNRIDKEHNVSVVALPSQLLPLELFLEVLHLAAEDLVFCRHVLDDSAGSGDKRSELCRHLG